MANIRLATDNIGSAASDKKTAETVCELLRKAGHTVTYHGRGPNKIQGVMRSSSNKCDIMIQIAGGRCIGTLCDFYLGINSGYYHAKQGAFLYFKKSFDWTVHRSGDDDFSTHPGTAVYREVNKWLGHKLADVYQAYKGKVYYGVGNTAEELAKTFIANYGGNTTESTETAVNTGSTIIDLIKQVMSDWKGYGAELTLTGDTVNIKRTNPNTAAPLNNSHLVNNLISITDYDNNTPNKYGSVRDEYLIDRFGVISLEKEEVNSTWESQVLQVAQGGHGHSIDLKVVLNPNFIEGRWVNLSLPQFNIYNRKYYILKTGLEDDKVMSLNLTPAPPEIYVDAPVETEGTTDDTTDTTEAT